MLCAERTEGGDWCARVDRGQPVVLSRDHVTCVPVERTVVALYDYTPREMSPNCDHQQELQFRAGDVILVYNLNPEEKDFYEVSAVVVINFVQLCPQLRLW